MYDAVFVLVEAFNKLLRKKPDQFRSYTLRRMGQLPVPGTNISNANAANNANAIRVLDCNTSKGRFRGSRPTFAAHLQDFISYGFSR